MWGCAPDRDLEQRARLVESSLSRASLARVTKVRSTPSVSVEAKASLTLSSIISRSPGVLTINAMAWRTRSPATSLSPSPCAAAGPANSTTMSTAASKPATRRGLRRFDNACRSPFIRDTPSGSRCLHEAPGAPGSLGPKSRSGRGSASVWETTVTAGPVVRRRRGSRRRQSRRPGGGRRRGGAGPPRRARRGRGDLSEDLFGACWLLHHAGDASNLTLDLVEPSSNSSQVGGVCCMLISVGVRFAAHEPLRVGDELVATVRRAEPEGAVGVVAAGSAFAVDGHETDGVGSHAAQLAEGSVLEPQDTVGDLFEPLVVADDHDAAAVFARPAAAAAGRSRGP